MAKTKSTRRSADMPCVLDFNEIANVLTYLNEQSKTPSAGDDQYTEGYADDLDHGRFVLYSMLVEHLRYAEYTHGEELREVMAENAKLREAAAKEVSNG
jgi:hypothetical protein